MAGHLSIFDSAFGPGNTLLDRLLSRNTTPGILPGLENPVGPPQSAATPSSTGIAPSPRVAPIVPPTAPDGVFGKIDSFLGGKGGNFLLNLLAQQGSSLLPTGGPLGAIGRAGLASQEDQRKNALLEARQRLSSRGSVAPSDVRRFEFFESLGSKSNPNKLSEAQKRFLEVQRATRDANVPGAGFGKNVGGEFEVTVPESIIVSGIGGREGAKEGAKQSEVTSAIPDQVGARGAAERHQDNISKGIPAADSMAVLRRGRELLDVIDTGGVDAAALRVKQAFGVEGADEAELSANLGKAVLSQLRTTFGAQFTQQEGERLQQIEAGFGKSTEGNKRLLDQAIKMVDRIANRGIESATSIGDNEAADLIRKSIDFTLTPDQSENKVIDFEDLP